MKATNKLAAMAAVAAVNPEGFTVNAETLQPVKHGFAVAVAETQNSFGPEGLARCMEYAANHPEVTAFGGWLDTETGLYYYDCVCIVYSEEEARTLAIQNKQIAFFDLDNMREVRV